MKNLIYYLKILLLTLFGIALYIMTSIYIATYQPFSPRGSDMSRIIEKISANPKLANATI